jgi:hypothetical protein
MLDGVLRHLTDSHHQSLLQICEHFDVSLPRANPDRQPTLSEVKSAMTSFVLAGISDGTWGRLWNLLCRVRHGDKVLQPRGARGES